MSLTQAPRTTAPAQGWAVRTSPAGEVVSRIAIRVLILFGVVFLMAPLIVIMVTSFNIAPALDFPPKQWSLSSYENISGQIYQSFFVSVELALLCTAGSLLLAVTASFALVRGRLPLTRGLETFFRAPLQVPQIVMGLALFQMFVLTQTSLGISLQAKLTGLVIAHIVLVTPYILATSVARIATMDAELEEAALGLGARPFVIFFRVTLPVVRQALIASAVLAFLVSFDNVPLSLFLSGPGMTTLPVALFNESESSLSSSIYAAASLTVVFSLVVTAILDRFIGLRSVLRR
ncbi:MAG: ABC transporter permease subunit [Propionibacteriales bacterium]|nr:ABC transporter permease subunit [Propionibacteriales bacterium]